MEYVGKFIGFVVSSVLAIAGLVIIYQMLKNGASVGAAIGNIIGGIVNLGVNIGHGVSNAFNKIL